MHQECVNERKEAVDVVKRRPAVPFIEPEGLPLRNDQMIKHTEIDMGRISFDAPQGIQRLSLIEGFEQVIHAKDSIPHFLFLYLVSHGPEAPAEERCGSW